MKTSLLKFKPMYKWIPTALTLGNTLCGFAAILNCLQAYRHDGDIESLVKVFSLSAWLIVGAMVFDMLDGWTARKFNVTSSHGLQMDSLADMVTFGVSPAIMIAVLAQMAGTPQYANLKFDFLPFQAVWVFCAIYVSCVALRLALYNVMAMEGRSTKGFRGLPSPGGAAAVASLIFVYKYLQANDTEGAALIIRLLPFYAAILGFIMVSPIPYEHLGKWLGKRKNNKLKIFLVIIFFSIFSFKPYLVAAISINAYILFGLLKYFTSLVMSKQGVKSEA